MTREQCKAITEKSDAFYVTERVVEGQKVEMYDYRLASISDFVDNNAFELRGLTFIYDSENDCWQENKLLQKFFNVGQTCGWMYDDVKNKKILRIQNKDDGSIISFCRFKNGNIRAKSKMSFESDQANMAQDIFMNNFNIRKFVTDMLNTNHVPVFELVGYQNQIVLNYKQDKELILLQIRDKDGNYLSKEKMRNLADVYKINVADDFENMSLDELLKLKEVSQDDIEGLVITFDDGQMAKIKINKYLQLHGLIGPDAFRENL
jgi:RNA ligase